MNFSSTYFNSFCSDFQQEVIRKSEEDGTTHEDKFTELMLDALEEADETENAFVCYHKKTGIKVNGYGINDSGDILDIFVSEYAGNILPVSIPKSKTELIFRRAENYFEKCLDGYYINLEEAQPVFDLSDRIYRFSSELRKIRFFLLTDRISRLEEIKDKEQGDFIYTYQVWDIERYHKLISSGKNRESITIKLKEDFNSPLPCLYEGDENPVYSSYFAVIHGKTLVALYDEYGPRLLERNVRSFLQVRGKVNKGIRDTVLNNPEMFLAYNNGLSTTAENITTEVVGGREYITQIHDFQIVNGAQTTATLHDTYIKKKDSIDLEFIRVPIKLTVLRDTSELNTLVPKISEYSNTQNKIDMADFSSNHPFHIKMEELSARIRAPSKEGIQLESYWYYERVRGQYLNKRNRESTSSKKKLFEKIYPKKQKFEKTELPVFEHTWQMRPYDVSLGKQKNYKLFMSEMESETKVEPDEKYFMNAVAKAILYKETYSIVRKELEGGYRSNIVTYSIAYLNYKTGNKISLERIWKDQDICDELRNILSYLVKDIQQFIITAPEGRNVTEYCKKKECWDKLCQENIVLSEEVSAAFSITGEKRKSCVFTKKSSKSGRSGSVSISSVSPEDWEKIASWGLETGYLNPKQRSVAKKIFYNKKAGKYCSADLMLDALNVINIANDAGFIFSFSSLSEEEDSKKSYESSKEIAKANFESPAISSVKTSGISDEMIEAELFRILKKYGGKCNLSDIIGKMEKEWEGQLTEYDLAKYKSGYPRWRVRVSSMKNHFIENKILKKYSKNGIWVLNPHNESARIKNLGEIDPETGPIRDNYGKILNTGISDEKMEKDIIHVLIEHKGAAKFSVLISELEDIWVGMLNEVDLEKSRTGSVRWRARVSSKKNILIKKGILCKHRQAGIWKLAKNLNNDAVWVDEANLSAKLELDGDLKDKNSPVSENNVINIPDIQKTIIQILSDNGGSDKMKHVHYELIRLSKLSDPKYQGIPNKRSAIRSEMISGKKSLVKAGLLEKKVVAGKWKLTPKAMETIDVSKSSNETAD